MNKIELEVALLRKGMSVEELSKRIGCNRVTLYRKLSSGKFERSEIIKIRDALELSDADMLCIFFNDECCVNATQEKDDDDD